MAERHSPHERHGKFPRNDRSSSSQSPSAVVSATASVESVQRPRRYPSRPLTAGYFDIAMPQSTAIKHQRSPVMVNPIGHLRTNSESSVTSTSTQPRIPRLLRNKSGQVVKSSMKATRRAAAASLHIDTHNIYSQHGLIYEDDNISAAQSAPLKSVQFDDHLEHIKHFIAEQRPTAISNDETPTDDTTTETEFPSFIFGPNRKKKLMMNMVNMPTTSNEDDISVLSILLSEDYQTVAVRVRVRNIAFQKRVSARYTFDAWQTTHEVTGRYLTSHNNGISDIFECIISLNVDHMENRWMLLAARYITNGIEMWDNNRGRNYQAMFTKMALRPSKIAQLATPISSSRRLTRKVDVRLTSSANSSDDEREVILRTRNVIKHRVASPVRKPSLQRFCQAASYDNALNDFNLLYPAASVQRELPRNLDPPKSAFNVAANESSSDSTPTLVSPSTSSSEPDEVTLERHSNPLHDPEYHSMINRCAGIL